MTRLKRALTLGLSALASALVLSGPATAEAVPAPYSVSSPSASTAVVQARFWAEIPPLCQSALPGEAHDTLDLIDQGGPFPHPEDGQVFENREGILPSEPIGYYHEYTVETPGSPDRGARRIVTGGEGEDYYTADHYASFGEIDSSC